MSLFTQQGWQCPLCQRIYSPTTPVCFSCPPKTEVTTTTAPLLPIHYMRDNHTFKRLSDDVSTALIEIEQEFNEGWTYGSLCSKRPGFPMIHASGSKKRLEFFAECKAALEAAHGIKGEA